MCDEYKRRWVYEENPMHSSFEIVSLIINETIRAAAKKFNKNHLFIERITSL